MTTEPGEGQPEVGTPAETLPRAGARLIDALPLAIAGVLLHSVLDHYLMRSLAGPLLAYVYFVVLDTVVGTTIGKRLFGMSVTGSDGRKPAIGQAARREAFMLLGAVPFIGPFVALVAWVVIGVTIHGSPTKQGRHDELAGGTQVLEVQRRRRAAGQRGERDAPTSSHGRWGPWILRWFSAKLTTVYVALAGYLAIDSGRPQDLLWMLLFVPLLALFVGMMTAVAWGLRWLWSRLALPLVHDAIVPVVILGALSGPLALFLIFANGDPRAILEPARAGLDVAFAAPTVLGGAVASYLAEHRVSARRPMWWVAVFAGAAIGLLLLEPIRSLLS